MNPAEQLMGLDLDGGWKVVGRATRKPNATGGHFSQGYIVEHPDGRRGYLKALDYMKAFALPTNAPLMLQAITQGYLFEKAICEKCNHLSRIVRAIGSGSILNPATPYHRVDYLIFELADEDIRAHLDGQTILDTAFVMKTLHHVATGLKQLHTADIAHQDLKPSNVLIYAAKAGSKICDLGRAWDKGGASPHDAMPIAGDKGYAPPELLYGEIPADERTRRFGCDLYHLGSLIVFCFSRVHMNGLLIDNLSPGHRPFKWAGTYRDILPFVVASFEVSLSQFANDVPEFIREDAKSFVAELCNPDPLLRGNPKDRGGNQFSLERYITRFDRLAHVAKLQLIGGSVVQNV